MNNVTPSATPPTGASDLSEFQGQFSASESATMAQWIKEDLAADKLTPEQANQAFDDLGTSPEQRLPDTRTDEQKQFDAAFPVARPEEYRIHYADPGQDPLPMTPELKQFDGAARVWLSEAGFSREVGSSVTKTIATVTTTTQKMNEAELERYGRMEYAKLERFYGGALESKLQQAGLMVEALEAKRPGLKALLQSHGIGDSALVASLLIQQAERFHVRRSR